MNFLAHCQLAWPDAGLVAGALEGDYFKGPLRGQLPGDIEAGVALHRAIDAYSDSHPLITGLRPYFPTELRRYSGILIDLSFDYFLSHHWQRFGPTPLADFNEAVYRLLQDQRAHLSPGTRRMVQRLVDHDLLNRYGDWATIIRSAEYISRRLQRDNSLASCGPALTALQLTLERAFVDFYPELSNFVDERRQNLPGDSGAP